MLKFSWVYNGPSLEMGADGNDPIRNPNGKRNRPPLGLIWGSFRWVRIVPTEICRWRLVFLATKQP